jgi:xanthosine utilization system XapX-like protein
MNGGVFMRIQIILVLWTILTILVGNQIFNGVSGLLATCMIMSAYFVSSAIWWFKGTYKE